MVAARSLWPTAQLRLISMVVASQVEVIEVSANDWARILELVGVYADLRLDVVDASTVAAAERLGLEEIATMDERDFRVIWPAHVDSFQLLP